MSISTKKWLLFTVATAILSHTDNTLAAAFQLIEQSGKGAGNAHAGEAARAEDASTVFFNPAGMTRLSGHQTSVALHFIMPKFDFEGTSAFNIDNPTIAATKLNELPLDQGSGNSGGGVNALVPNIYYVHDYSQDLKLGIGLNAPFGLVTEYDKQWAGRYSAIKSELLTININPSVAYRLNQQFSVGAGLNFMYATVELSNAIDYNLLYKLASFKNPQLPNLSLMPGNTSGDGIAKVRGDDWGFGFNLGLLWELKEGTRLGLAYRSKVSLDISGDASFSNPSDRQSLQAVEILRGAAGVFKDSDAQSSIDLPETIALNFYHELMPKLTILGGINWTQWDRIDNLNVQFDNPAQANSITRLNYENSTFSSLGLNYKYTPVWTFKAGIAYDQSPVSDAQERSPRIPDNDRFWLALGATYNKDKRLSIDVGYAHLFINDIDIDSSEAYSAGAHTSGYHRLTGKYKANVNIFDVQLNWRF
ncbi:MAG: outer membrane protein transport protein [Pseudomonadota bacterium]